MNHYEYRPLSVPRRTIMGPGPSSTDPRVLKAMAQPIVGYLDPWYFELLDEVSDMLAMVWQTQQRVLVINGSGSAGMEAGFTNLVEAGDKVVICSNGYFCERQVIMAKRLGLNVIEVKAEWGRAFPPELLEAKLKEHPDAKMVSAIHAETSTGALSDVAALSRIAHAHGMFIMLDCVTSLAGCEILFDDWGIDFAYSASQKCLACPPGTSPCALSDRAYDHITARTKRGAPPLSWYLDLRLTADYWDKQHIPHYTSSVTQTYALREGLALTLSEGLNQRWQRHAVNSSALQFGLTEMGIDLLVPAAERLSQLTPILVNERIDDVALRDDLLNDFHIEVGRGLGDLMGKVIRIGLMGESCNRANVFTILDALETVLPRHGMEIKGEGTGVAAAAQAYTRNGSPDA